MLACWRWDTSWKWLTDFLESARIKANGILAQDKLPLHPVKPLPKIENYSRKEFKLKQRAAAIQTNS